LRSASESAQQISSQGQRSHPDSIIIFAECTFKAR
jgi:hypothetical protein